MWPAIIGALGSVGVGIGSWFGQRSANKENERLSKEQMAFQERMSSTSAERSVEDYTRAGLNPALAYDRPASSPAGSLSRVEDAVGKGISSALQAKALHQSLENARVQNEATKLQTQADIELKSSQSLRNLQEGATSVSQNALLGAQLRFADQNIKFSAIDQPFSTRQKAAEAAIREFGVAGARNQSALDTRLGEMSPGLRLLLQSASQAARIFRPF